jgi:hypothetical protein
VAHSRHSCKARRVRSVRLVDELLPKTRFFTLFVLFVHGVRVCVRASARGVRVWVRVCACWCASAYACAHACACAFWGHKSEFWFCFSGVVRFARAWTDFWVLRGGATFPRRDSFLGRSAKALSRSEKVAPPRSTQESPLRTVPPRHPFTHPDSASSPTAP